MTAIYSAALWAHFRNPHGRGRPAGANATGSARYPRCGDRLELFLRVEGGRVVEAGFEAVGCGAAVAAGSAATTLLKGRPISDARSLTAFELDRALGGVPPSKRHSLLMVLECVAAALGPRADVDPA